MVNEAHLDWTDPDCGDVAFQRKKLASAAGGDELDASLYELAPGKRSWPLYHHTANEEAVYVLAGEETLRRGDDRADRMLSPGDYVALPADESGTHQIVNGGDDPLRYLMVPTINDSDVTVYPEADHVGVFAGAPPGGRGSEPSRNTGIAGMRSTIGNNV